MPALGMAQETGRLLRWIKAEGDVVAKGEPVMEVETDKVTVEIESPADGVLGGVSAVEGEDVPVGRAVAFVLAPGEAVPVPERAPGEAVPESVGVGVGGVSAANGASVAAVPEPLSNSLLRGGLGAGVRRVLASPKARRLARERGVPIEEVVGSGPYGAVQAADVLAFAVGVPEAAPVVAPLVTSRGWRVMAERMVGSWQQVPHFYVRRDVDATRLNSWREAVRRRAGFEKVTHTDLLVRVCAAALREHPRVNASWVGDAVVAQAGVNVGIAVATDDALIVPVVRDADRIGLKEIAGRRGELVSRARERRLRPEDVAGGTFTISNLGMFGVDAFHAIVNTPQAAILAVGRILDRVVVVDGAPAVRPVLTLTLSFDHRVVDGAEGARFLDTLAALVEEPAGLVT